MMVPKSPELGVAMAFFRQNKAEKTTLVTPFIYFFSLHDAVPNNLMA